MMHIVECGCMGRVVVVPETSRFGRDFVREDVFFLFLGELSSAGAIFALKYNKCTNAQVGINTEIIYTSISYYFMSK